MVLSPCLDCTERHEACWGECEAYQKFREEKKAEKEAMKAYKEHNTRRGERVFAKVKGQV